MRIHFRDFENFATRVHVIGVAEIDIAQEEGKMKIRRGMRVVLVVIRVMAVGALLQCLGAAAWAQARAAVWRVADALGCGGQDSAWLTAVQRAPRMRGKAWWIVMARSSSGR